MTNNAKVMALRPMETTPLSIGFYNPAGLDGPMLKKAQAIFTEELATEYRPALSARARFDKAIAETARRLEMPIHNPARDMIVFPRTEDARAYAKANNCYCFSASAGSLITPDGGLQHSVDYTLEYSDTPFSSPADRKMACDALRAYKEGR